MNENNSSKSEKEFDKYIYNFIINNKCIEYTEPIEELIRERNTTIKYGEKTTFPYFWCYSVNNFFVSLEERKRLSGIFANQRVKVKDLEENFIVISTNDINLRDWLKIKLPDFLDLSIATFHSNYSTDFVKNYYLDDPEKYNGFLTSLKFAKDENGNAESMNYLYEDLYGKV